MQHLILTGVEIGGRGLGWGSFARVFEVSYNGITCAAKGIDSTLLEKWKDIDAKQITKDFFHECLVHSKFHHPNVVNMLGVYYPNKDDQLPVLVMELMKYNLNKFLEESHDIPKYVKLSMLKDVSRGILYLHTLSPPVIHCNLSTHNILLTENLLVKLSDFKAATFMVPSPKIMKRAPGSADYMAPEAVVVNPHYGLPLDVFSFGCVVCHMISEQWPSPSSSSDDSVSREVKRRQRYIDQISDGSLKQLVVSCLDDNPKCRPQISEVCTKITSTMTSK